jgi:hypothetical protein
MNEFIESSNLYTTECVISSKNSFNIITHCIICNEAIERSMFDSHIQVCDKCKNAIKYLRDQLEAE